MSETCVNLNLSSRSFPVVLRLSRKRRIVFVSEAAVSIRACIAEIHTTKLLLLMLRFRFCRCRNLCFILSSDKHAVWEKYSMLHFTDFLQSFFCLQLYTKIEAKIKIYVTYILQCMLELTVRVRHPLLWLFIILLTWNSLCCDNILSTSGGY